jgi:hypothetical protein
MSTTPRDYKAAYARRQARARALGFSGYRQLRAAGGTAVARLNLDPPSGDLLGA